MKERRSRYHEAGPFLNESLRRKSASGSPFPNAGTGDLAGCKVLFPPLTTQCRGEKRNKKYRNENKQCWSIVLVITL